MIENCYGGLRKHIEIFVEYRALKNKSHLQYFQIISTIALFYIRFCDGKPLPQSGGIIRTNNPAFDLFFAPELIFLSAINQAVRNGR